MSDSNFELIIPFWIDTEGYTDRDREMFVCGFEFGMVVIAINKGDGWNQCIHSENTSRVRMLCAKMKVDFKITLVGQDGWMHLEISKRG